MTIAKTPDLPEDMLALLDHYHLDLAGTYGDPQGRGLTTRGRQVMLTNDEMLYS